MMYAMRCCLSLAPMSCSAAWAARTRPCLAHGHAPDLDRAGA